MASDKTLISDFEDRLDLKERDMLARRADVFAFLDTEHKSSASKKQLKDLRKAQAKIDGIMAELYELKSSSEFRDEAEKLCRRCKALYDYTRDMNKDLSDDFAERRRTEDNGKVDLVKYAGFVVITIVGAMTAQKMACLATN